MQVAARKSATRLCRFPLLGRNEEAGAHSKEMGAGGVLAP